MLAGVLAVLGYSVNESVVIFDRIREAFRKFRKLSTPEVIDHAITSTMSRTIITHASTEAMVLIDVLLRWPQPAQLLAGPDDWHFVRYLFVGVRGGRHCRVAGREARRLGENDEKETAMQATARMILTRGPWSNALGGTDHGLRHVPVAGMWSPLLPGSQRLP